MSSSIKLYKLYFLSVLIAIIGSLLKKELIFVLVSGLTVVMATFSTGKDLVIFRKGLKVVSPMILLLIFGLITISNADFYNISRDVFLVSKVIFYFLAGCLVSRLKISFLTFYRCLFVAALFSSAVHIYDYWQYDAVSDSIDLQRKELGYGSTTEFLFVALYASSFFKKYKHLSFNLLKVIPILISLVLYFSRSMYISLLLVFLFASGIIVLSQLKFSFKYVFSFAVAGLFIFWVLNFADASDESPLGWMVHKFQNMPNEVFWDEKQDRTAGLREINDNWRGYEAYQGIKMYYDGTLGQKIFGYGFGALVNLHMIMNLDDQEFSEIPILHNGYIMLLVKQGIFGIILYLAFLVSLLFNSSGRTYESVGSPDFDAFQYNQLLTAFAVLTILTTITTIGILNPHDILTPILLGFFWSSSKRLSYMGKPSIRAYPVRI